MIDLNPTPGTVRLLEAVDRNAYPDSRLARRQHCPPQEIASQVDQ
jgi:hypothetical protein